jgi:hypothetical protein
MRLPKGGILVVTAEAHRRNGFRQQTIVRRSMWPVTGETVSVSKWSVDNGAGLPLVDGRMAGAAEFRHRLEQLIGV